MHGINQISSIQIFAMVIILHNPTSGDKSRFNILPKRLETTKKSTRSRPRYLDANWRIRVFSPTIDFCKSFTASINSHELTS